MMNSKLKHTAFFIAAIFMSLLSTAQNSVSEKVKLIEKQNGKRLELFAKNEDSISYSIFLRIETSNYRRYSNRPVLVTVEPNSEKHLITLIKLANKPDDYEKIFIVNEVSQKLTIRKDYDDFEINFDDALKTKNLTLYVSENCSLCNDTKALLDKYKIAYTTKDITKDKSALIEALNAAKKSIDNIDTYTFALQTKTNIYTDIKSKKELIDVLKNI